MSLLIVLLTAAAGPLFVPSRNLLAGIIGMAALFTGLTVWGLLNSDANDAGGGRYAATAIAGLLAGTVVRLAHFRLKTHVEDQAARRTMVRELPERHR